MALKYVKESEENLPCILAEKHLDEHEAFWSQVPWTGSKMAAVNKKDDLRTKNKGKKTCPTAKRGRSNVLQG